MRVTLIYPPGGYRAARWDEGGLPSLGLGYLAAYLEKHGVECEILDAQVLSSTPRDIRKYLQSSRPAVIGVAFTTENRFIGFETIRQAKSAVPPAYLVAGGPHVSVTADDTLIHVPELDAVVRGEGEVPLLELVRRLESGLGLESVPSLTYRQDGRIASNPPADFVDLDDLPFPARHLMPMDKYQTRVDVPGAGKLKSLNIMASRGCPYDCNFCASPQMWGRRFRSRSPDYVLAEVDELIHRYGAEALWIFDDTFTIDRRRTVEICEGIAERFPNLRWTCEIRVDCVDRELLALMRRAGCYCVAFGVESGSQRIIDKSIGKRIKLDQVHEVVAHCRETGLQYNPFMILSHPGETEEDARETMRLIREWKKDGASVSLAIMHIYPGTRLESSARREGLLPQDFSWSSEEDARRVATLPSAQGHAPILLDKLSWDFLSSCMFEWAEMERYSILKRIPKALAGIRSLSDIGRYLGMLKVYLRRKLLPSK